MMQNNAFQLFLFTTRKDIIADALHGGISGFVIDWENKGKVERQENADTQINYNTLEDLRSVRSLTDRLVLCRINRVAEISESQEEIDLAIDGGTDEILLPMVQTVREVEETLNYVNGRCGVGILIETTAAVGLSKELGKLPLSRVYAGLNDLAIDRNKSNIFDSLEDGTVDYIKQFITVPFGFAGLTLPERGYPVPCRLLISEMVRLGCSFSFLRRSFLADTKGQDVSSALHKIQKGISQGFKCSDEERENNTIEIKEVIKRSPNNFRTQ